MNFEVNDKTMNKINRWLIDTVYPEVIKQQKESIAADAFIQSCWDANLPYSGAIGGGLTYSFTPTSIGVIVKVSYLDYELDVTDYDEW